MSDTVGSACRFALWLVCGFLAAAAAARGEPAAEDTVTVTLHPCDVAPGPRVVVGDVAALQGGDSELRARIAGLDLTDDLHPGKKVTVTASQVRFRLQVAGIEPHQFRVEGPRSVNVQVAAIQTVSLVRYQVTEDELLTRARQEVLQRLGVPADALAVQFAQPVRSVPAVAGRKEDVTLAADLPSRTPPLGQVRVDVKVLVRGRPQGVVPVVLDVKFYQRVAVAAQAVEAGQVFRADNVRLERRAVDGVNSSFTSLDTLANKRAARAVAAGQVLVPEDVEALPELQPLLVKQRELVSLTTRAGPLEIKTKGEALQDGRAGQLIRVRNVDTNKVVIGRVVDRSVVQVSF